MSNDRRAHRRSRKPPQRPTFLGVVGEIFITLGVVTFLFVAWQLWIGDLIYGAERNAAGDELSQQWAQEYEPPASTPDATQDPAEPIILDEPADAEIFANMLIPRFGDDYNVNIAGGVSRERTLDPIGIGHYPGTKMPGEVGNFALAAHRTTWGKPFNQIAELQLGDPIVVETKEGWYTYRFRTLEYVTPNEVDVLLPVPQRMDVAADTAYITLTSCSPMYSLAERIVAYGVFDSFTPRSDGAPTALTEGV
jgi:sortase A